ncbi:MAG: hypothetical protein UZ08_BCD001001945 [Candidatus Parvibacillus calidus]|nr:MAG: hypothetical protein UZ08_BCD001001945 [Candidatus Parvibacillus calidus]
MKVINLNQSSSIQQEHRQVTQIKKFWNNIINKHIFGCEKAFEVRLSKAGRQQALSGN